MIDVFLPCGEVEKRASYILQLREYTDYLKGGGEPLNDKRTALMVYPGRIRVCLIQPQGPVIRLRDVCEQ